MRKGLMDYILITIQFLCLIWLIFILFVIISVLFVDKPEGKAYKCLAGRLPEYMELCKGDYDKCKNEALEIVCKEIKV